MSIADALVDDVHARSAVESGERHSIEIIGCPEDVSKLAEEWQGLHRSNTVNRLYFQSFSWTVAWLSSFATLQDYQQLAIVVARSEGRLRAICPFVLTHKRGMTHLCWAGGPASQYGDVLTDGSPASPNAVIDAVEFAVNTLKPDVVHLRKVRQDAAVQAWLAQVEAHQTGVEQAPYISFDAGLSLDEFSARYSGKARKNRRRLRRRLCETGRITTEVLGPGGGACGALKAAISFKQQWLRDRGHLTSALRNASVVDMLCAFVDGPILDGKPFVSVMRRDQETTLSVQFGIISNDRLALHVIAYNPQAEKLGAGVLHMEDTIRYCIDNGLSELDLLAPNAAYKRDWSDSAMPVADYVVARSLKGRLYAQAYLNTTRDLLKSGIETLPLSLRKNLAQHWHR